MQEDRSIVEFHVDARELALLRERGRFTSAYNETRATVRREIRKITAVLEDELKRVFSEEHPHKERDEPDPYHPVPTIDTFHIVPEGMMTFRIMMGGGAVFIEKGWAPHYIVARGSMSSAIEANLPQRYNERARGGPAMTEGSLANAVKSLRWTDEGGEHFARMVVNPGYAEHPFVNRAIDSPEVQLLIARLGRLVALDFKMRAFSPLTGEALGGEA